jgi:hypothetical protein
MDLTLKQHLKKTLATKTLFFKQNSPPSLAFSNSSPRRLFPSPILNPPSKGFVIDYKKNTNGVGAYFFQESFAYLFSGLFGNAVEIVFF